VTCRSRITNSDMELGFSYFNGELQALRFFRGYRVNGSR
jgi:hypothetical protein